MRELLELCLDVCFMVMCLVLYLCALWTLVDAVYTRQIENWQACFYLYLVLMVFRGVHALEKTKGE